MKSHFKFSNKQRNGIFILLLLIIIIQIVLVCIDFYPDTLNSNSEILAQYRKEIDSLKSIKQNKNNQPKIYPFNPNFITDYKGYKLGMTSEEIDRLHNFRANNQWVNSAKDFQKVTKVSDSLLAVLSPYFKFPEWVNSQKHKHYKPQYSKSKKTKTSAEKTDLNIATAEQLKKVYGIGEKLSQNIINYRQKHNGFIADIELNEIYGLSPEVIENIKQHFTVKTPKPILTHNLNTATIEELVTIRYIDYEIANHIIEERTLRDGFKNLEDLTKVEDFPLKRFAVIKLYLYIQ